MLDRREMLGSLGLASAALMEVNSQAQAPDHRMAGMDVGECIALCVDAHRICLETVGHVSRSADRPSTALVAILTDCAELCQATANSMIRGSPMHSLLCRACAQACERCAAECLQARADDQLKQCAAKCGACASACREMGA